MAIEKKKQGGKESDPFFDSLEKQISDYDPNSDPEYKIDTTDPHENAPLLQSIKKWQKDNVKIYKIKHLVREAAIEVENLTDIEISTEFADFLLDKTFKFIEEKGLFLIREIYELKIATNNQDSGRLLLKIKDIDENTLIVHIEGKQPFDIIKISARY